MPGPEHRHANRRIETSPPMRQRQRTRHASRTPSRQQAHRNVSVIWQAISHRAPSRTPSRRQACPGTTRRWSGTWRPTATGPHSRRPTAELQASPSGRSSRPSRSIFQSEVRRRSHTPSGYPPTITVGTSTCTRSTRCTESHGKKDSRLRPRWRTPSGPSATYRTERDTTDCEAPRHDVHQAAAEPGCDDGEHDPHDRRPGPARPGNSRTRRLSAAQPGTLTPADQCRGSSAVLGTFVADGLG
jgi:hypothetical protein